MRPIAVSLAALLVLLFAACGEEARFNANPTPSEDPEAKAIAADIAALADGAKAADPEASVRYDAAVNALILRGMKIETRMIDTLRSSPDAWVRIGCIEVLTAVASKLSVEHLIAVLDDAEPLVAQRANIALQTVTGQRLVPEAGKPPLDGLPPVPPRPADDLALDAEERLWAAWHAQHKDALKAAWQRWWIANKATATLQ